MPIEDFEGRWRSRNEWDGAITIEIKGVDGRPAVRTFYCGTDEAADISGVDLAEDRLCFVARWAAGRTTTYTLRWSDGHLEVHGAADVTDILEKLPQPDSWQRRRSGILHIVPGRLAFHEMQQAIERSGRGDCVDFFPDDLSCGPIASDDPAARRDWWASFGYAAETWDATDFWQRIATTIDRLVIWFGRHSAFEHAFFLALAERLGDRPYSVVDVTKLPEPGPDGAVRDPVFAVLLVPEADLVGLFDTERAISAEGREEVARRWRTLKSENAPYRIVTEAGLVSAPVDVFDADLLAQATTEWRQTTQIVGHVMVQWMEPYIQVGDMVLFGRIDALIKAGKLIERGDAASRWEHFVRLPGASPRHLSSEETI